eukprot:117950_1
MEHFTQVPIKNLPILVNGYIRDINPTTPEDIMNITFAFIKDGIEFSEFVSRLKDEAIQEYKNGSIQEKDLIIVQELQCVVNQNTIHELSNDHYSYTINSYHIKGLHTYRLHLLTDFFRLKPLQITESKLIEQIMLSFNWKNKFVKQYTDWKNKLEAL